MRPHLALLLAGIAGLLSELPLRADDTPIRKLHVLFAIDTNSNLRDSVTLDHDRMDRLLRAHVQGEKLEIVTLKGKDVTAENVLKHYQNHKFGPGDAVLFFYAGHGAKDPKKGHAFVPQMQKTPPIYRSDVVEVMKKSGAGLVVVLSDCCSTEAKLAGKPFYGTIRPVKPASATATHPTLEALFFRHRGVVDLTAASDKQASWGDHRDGGIFTRTLARLLLQPSSDFQKEKGSVLTWAEFFPAVKKETEGTFRSWQSKMRSKGEEVDQAAQTPASFSLGEAVRGIEPVDGKGPPVHAVICLVNESGEELRYKFRWAETDEWKSTTLADKKRSEHSTPVGKSGIPKFAILMEGNKKPIELDADTWTGEKVPPGAAGREYPIILRKK